MTGAALATCSTASAKAASCSPTELMTAMHYAPHWQCAARGPASSRCRTASALPPSALPPASFNHRLPAAWSPFLYRYRNLVERFFNKLKHFRAIATRYDKRDDNFLASVQLASIRIWLRHNESVA